MSKCREAFAFKYIFRNIIIPLNNEPQFVSFVLCCVSYYDLEVVRYFAQFQVILLVLNHYCNSNRYFAQFRVILQVLNHYCNSNRYFAQLRVILLVLNHYCNSNRYFAQFRVILLVLNHYCNSKILHVPSVVQLHYCFG